MQPENIRKCKNHHLHRQYIRKSTTNKKDILIISPAASRNRQQNKWHTALFGKMGEFGVQLGGTEPSKATN
jgi:hypothetical protein